MSATLLAMVTCAVVAHAESREGGTSGGITAPTAEVMPRGKTSVAVSASASATQAGSEFGILPFGVGYSYGRNTELGFVIGLEPQSLGNPTFGGTRLGVRYRRRVSGAIGKGLPVVIEAGVEGFTGSWGADVGAAFGARMGGFDVHPSVAVHWAEPETFSGSGSLVVARYLPPSLRLLGELNARAAWDGLHSADARLGLRVPLMKRVHVVAWAGGGLRGESPWGGGGATLMLYALDPRDVDRDGDQIGDWKDKCPNDPEDVDKFEDYDGCPDADNDGDGIPDGKDPTPNGEASTPLNYTGATPLLRMRIHERGLPGDDPDGQ